MDMHANEASDDADDTLSLSDLQIYSDPSSSSEEPYNRNSLSSFRFTIVSTPRPEKGNGSCFDDSLVPAARPRRMTGSGFLMFGLGKSPTRMELCDLRSRQARGSPARIFPFNGGGEEEATPRRRPGNWSGKLFGACIPML
ncbi:unnamed protein product [Lactuca virosa]|uniref:Uncharacterized protein n=1 Tax=Lactuca virosa TaxID=75947 RepID=A0AAU9NL00_9ASTR|nr:unnamed protein product [Lactuca virosa]